MKLELYNGKWFAPVNSGRFGTVDKIWVEPSWSRRRLRRFVELALRNKFKAWGLI